MWAINEYCALCYTRNEMKRVRIQKKWMSTCTRAPNRSFVVMFFLHGRIDSRISWFNQKTKTVAQINCRSCGKRTTIPYADLICRLALSQSNCVALSIRSHSCSSNTRRLLIVCGSLTKGSYFMVGIEFICKIKVRKQIVAFHCGGVGVNFVGSLVAYVIVYYAYWFDGQWKSECGRRPNLSLIIAISKWSPRGNFRCVHIARLSNDVYSLNWVQYRGYLLCLLSPLRRPFNYEFRECGW